MTLPERSSIIVSMNRLSNEKRTQIVSALVEGNSIRGWFDPPRDPADSGSSGREMRRLLARGSARSLFSGVRDSTATHRRSRNYILGASIDILFANGEPDEIIAEQAIGVFLEPTAEVGGGVRE